MRKLFLATGLAFIMAGMIAGCKKSSTEETIGTALTADEKALVVAAGFNGNWAEKSADGNYLIEGDIYLTKSQLQDLVGKTPANELIIANEEHYRTTNLVSSSGSRVITISLAAGFPAHYSAGLDAAIARYNSYALTISFQRVASGGEIHISGANLGRAVGGGCILGRAAGFPTGGNPSSGFTLSTSKCATSYLNTSAKADEVMAHEIGHCIGFRHTDYMNRSSCGSNSNEGDAGVGAIWIPGTPTTVTGSYDSWMMACTNGSAAFSSADGTALTTVY